MDLLLKVFMDLGANQSLFIQFGIIIVMFVLSKFLFLNHLQNILDTREAKTSKLDGDAEKQFAEVEKAQAEYKEKISKANKTVKAKVDNGKNDISKKYEGEYRSQEKEINAYIESSKKEVQESIQEKREKVLSDADQLSSSLVQKITKGI